MTDRERIIKELDTCMSASCRGYKPGIYCPLSDEVWAIIRDALELLKKSFTPQEVYDIVRDHAQHDKRFKLGDKIDYSFTDVVDILNIELMCKAGDM